MLWRRYSNRDFRTRAKARAVYKALCEALVAALALVLLAPPAMAAAPVPDGLYTPTPSSGASSCLLAVPLTAVVGDILVAQQT